MAVQLGSTEDTLEMWPLETAGCSAVQFTYRFLRDLCSELLLKCRGGVFQGQETQFQTRIGRGSLTTCIYIVTPNRSEIKHYGGVVLQGGGYHV